MLLQETAYWHDSPSGCNRTSLCFDTANRSCDQKSTNSCVVGKNGNCPETGFGEGGQIGNGKSSWRQGSAQHPMRGPMRVCRYRSGETSPKPTSGQLHQSGRNHALRDETASPPVYASLSSSVRYLGATAFTLSMNAACYFSESLGGGVVRVETGTPTSKKNFSCPAGEQIQSMRTASPEAL